MTDLQDAAWRSGPLSFKKSGQTQRFPLGMSACSEEQYKRGQLEKFQLYTVQAAFFSSSTRQHFIGKTRHVTSERNLCPLSVNVQFCLLNVIAPVKDDRKARLDCH